MNANSNYTINNNMNSVQNYSVIEENGGKETVIVRLAWKPKSEKIYTHLKFYLSSLKTQVFNDVPLKYHYTTLG